MDEGDDEEEEEEEEKEKTGTGQKGKIKEETGWKEFKEDERCELCIRDNAECLVNAAALERWREEWLKGKSFTRNPPATNCHRCGDKKKKCDLPATKEMRRKGGGGAPRKLVVPPAPILQKAASSVAASETSSGKRKVFAGVEMPARKRVKATGEVSDVQVQIALLELLKEIRSGIGRLAEAEERTAAGMETLVGVFKSSHERGVAQGETLRGILEEMRKDGKKSDAAEAKDGAAGKSGTGGKKDEGSDSSGEYQSGSGEEVSRVMESVDKASESSESEEDGSIV